MIWDPLSVTIIRVESNSPEVNKFEERSPISSKEGFIDALVSKTWRYLLRTFSDLHLVYYHYYLYFYYYN